MKFSADPRNSADFCGILVPLEFSANLGRNLKGRWGRGNSVTIGPTGMVHPSKFTEFYEEMFENVFKIVAMWDIPHILAV